VKGRERSTLVKKKIALRESTPAAGTTGDNQRHRFRPRTARARPPSRQSALSVTARKTGTALVLPRLAEADVVRLRVEDVNKSTQIFLLALLGLAVGCAHPCQRCRRNSGDGVRIVRDRRDDDDDLIVDDDPLRRQLEQALLQQNNPGVFANGIANGFGQGLNPIGLPQQGPPSIFDQNNQGQAAIPGNTGTPAQPSGAQPLGGTPSGSFAGTGPAPLSGSGTVAAEAPVRRLQALVDPSTHGAGDESAPVRRRTTE